MENPKILIIDDERDICESLKYVLSTKGYIVDVAHTAGKGVEKIKKVHFNLVLLDMRLPDYDGIKALEKIKEISPDTEVVILTAYANIKSVIEAMEKNAFSYLPKPFEIPHLISILEKAYEKQTLSLLNRDLFQKISDAKKNWETTFDSISDMISIHDIDFNIIKCNKAFAKKFNSKPEDIVGKNYYEVFHGKDGPLSKCPLKRCKGTLKPETEEIEYPQMGGIFLISCFPRFDKLGSFTGIVRIARDITGHKKVEERIKHLASFPQLDINPILEVNLSGEITFYNNAASNILKKLGLKEDLNIFLPENIKETFYDLKMKKNVSIFCEVKIESLTFEENIHYVSTINVLRIYTRDITERKQAEKEIKQSLEKLKMAMEGVINTLALTVEQRDPYTAGHQQRVAKLSCAIAEDMGIPAAQIEGIRMAGVVHDIGKMHIPSEILNRPGKLTKDEFNIVKSHAQVGYDILRGIAFPWPVADIVHQHHENMDGSGYPLGMSNGDILMGARILCVADVVEAMASHRPYRPALGMDKALEEISKKNGLNYDDRVVSACLKVIKGKKFEFEDL